MRTPRPAARSALTVSDVMTETFNMFGPRLGFLYRCRPTNPFVTRERCKAIPRGTYLP